MSRGILFGQPAVVVGVAIAAAILAGIVEPKINTFHTAAARSLMGVFLELQAAVQELFQKPSVDAAHGLNSALPKLGRFGAGVDLQAAAAGGFRQLKG